MHHGPIVASGYFIQIPNYWAFKLWAGTTADLENNFHARHSIEEDTPLEISTLMLCTRDNKMILPTPRENNNTRTIECETYVMA